MLVREIFLDSILVGHVALELVGLYQRGDVDNVQKGLTIWSKVVDFSWQNLLDLEFIVSDHILILN